MRIHQGFISNSSSCSFIIIGKILSFDQVVALRNEDERPDIYVVTKECLYDGSDGFELDDPMIDLILLLSKLDNKNALLNLKHNNGLLSELCRLQIDGVKIKTSMPDSFIFYQVGEVISEETKRYNEPIVIPEGMKRYDHEIEYMHTSNCCFDLVDRYCNFNGKSYEDYLNENT
jgi:hypothetical protein